VFITLLFVFSFKQKRAYEIRISLVGSEMCIRASNDSELEAAITRLLSQPDELRNLNASAALFIQDRAQVLERILAAIQTWMPDPGNHCARPV